jgi:hypothetical protein
MGSMYGTINSQRLFFPGRTQKAGGRRRSFSATRFGRIMPYPWSGFQGENVRE